MSNILSFLLFIIKPQLASVVWIIILFVLAKVLLRKIVKKIIQVVDHGDKKAQRAKTLGSIITTSGNIIIYIIIILMILTMFGVNIGPILAGAGILGLAVGFGSQTLVKDFVSGLFILLENQYAVGEKVKIGSHTGEVIKMSIRSTTLRDQEGNVIFLSNNKINEVVNYSRQK
jgi:small conductance mechanosensitive channel